MPRGALSEPAPDRAGAAPLDQLDRRTRLQVGEERPLSAQPAEAEQDRVEGDPVAGAIGIEQAPPLAARHLGPPPRDGLFSLRDSLVQEEGAVSAEDVAEESMGVLVHHERVELRAWMAGRDDVDGAVVEAHGREAEAVLVRVEVVAPRVEADL